MCLRACLEHSLPSVQSVLRRKCRNLDQMKIDPIYGKNPHTIDNIYDLKIYNGHYDLYLGDENNSIPGIVRDVSKSKNSFH